MASLIKSRHYLGCICTGTTAERRANWVVITLRANYSTFNGSRRTPSDYSEIRCTGCGRRWRTKAAYVDSLPVNENLDVV